MLLNVFHGTFGRNKQYSASNELKKITNEINSYFAAILRSTNLFSSGIAVFLFLRL